MSNVNATLNVLARLITSGGSTDPLIEHLEMRGVIDDTRKINLFDGERGPRKPLNWGCVEICRSAVSKTGIYHLTWAFVDGNDFHADH